MKMLILAAITLMLITQLRAQINVINEPQNNRIIVNFTMPSYRIADTNIYSAYGINQLYKYIYVNDDDFDVIDSIGLPELPCITTSIAIPNNATVTNVTTENMTWINKPIDRRVFPSQEYSKEDNATNTFMINNAYYNSTGNSFLNREYVLGENFSVFSQQGIALTILPFLYNPASSLIRELRSGVFIINYTSDESKSNTDQYTSDIRENYLMSTFNNYSPSPLCGSSSGGGRLMIITPEKFLKTLTYYINYRKNVGFTVDVLTTEHIASLGLGIKGCIQQRYDNVSNRPDFVLLVGDTGDIPVSAGDASSEDWNNPITDIFYSTLSGDDLFADVHLGRWSISGENELCNIINKTLQMEMFMHTYEKKANFVSGYFSPEMWEWEENRIHNKVIDESLAPAGFRCERFYQPNQIQVDDSLNNNPLYYIYSGHGNKSRMAIVHGELGLDSNVINSITTINTIFPIGFSFSCETGNFAVNACLGESWIRSHKGGIAYLGSSVTTLATCDPIIERKILIESFPNNAYLGSIINGGKRLYFERFWKWKANVKRYIKSYNLLGDPCFLKSGIGIMDNYNFENAELFVVGAKVKYHALGEIKNSNDFDICSYANVELRSNEKISLRNGFHASVGSKFSAKIGGVNQVSNFKSDNTEDSDMDYRNSNINNIDNVSYSVFPNPVNDKITFKITSHDNDNITINIYNIGGDKIHSKTVTMYQGECQEVSFELSSSSTGLLLYEIVSQNDIFTGKIIKK